MKTKLTKSILFLSLIMSILFPVSSFAAINQTSDTISHVEFDSDCGVFYAVSKGDSSGSWVLYLLSSENENKAITDSLNAILARKKINIVYDDYETNDTDYWDIVEWSLIE